MDRRYIVTACLLALVLFVAGWTLKPAPAQAWEYKTEYLPDDKKLNALGADGWELVAIAPKGIALGYVFKRAK